MATRDNYADIKGPTRGSTKAVSQHKAMALGYEVAGGPKVVKTFQKAEGMGESELPGLTSSRGKAPGRFTRE